MLHAVSRASRREAVSRGACRAGCSRARGGGGRFGGGFAGGSRMPDGHRTRELRLVRSVTEPVSPVTCCRRQAAICSPSCAHRGSTNPSQARNRASGLPRTHRGLPRPSGSLRVTRESRVTRGPRHHAGVVAGQRRAVRSPTIDQETLHKLREMKPGGRAAGFGHCDGSGGCGVVEGFDDDLDALDTVGIVIAPEAPAALDGEMTVECTEEHGDAGTDGCVQ